MAKIIHDLSLADIAPPSIKNDETVKNIISAIDPELLSVSDAISEAFIISRIKELPEPVLDLLAWQWHVDFYELANNLDAKREMVLGSIQWHRKKGTRGAILSALEMLGVEAKFTAWYEEEENKNNPYTFAIDAKLTEHFWERVDWTKPTQTIRRAILESKAARSYMSRLYIYFEAETQEDITVGAGLFSGAHYEIKPLFEDIDEKNTLNIHEALLLSPGAHYEIKPLFEDIDDKAALNVNPALAGITGSYYLIKPQFKPIDEKATLNFNAASAGIAGSHYIVKQKSFSDTVKMSENEALAGFIGYHYDIDWQQLIEAEMSLGAASAGFIGYHYSVGWQHCMETKTAYGIGLAGTLGYHYDINWQQLIEGEMTFDEVSAGFTGYHYDVGWQYGMEAESDFNAASAGFTGYHYDVGWQHCMDAKSTFNPAVAVVQGISTTLKMKGA